MQFLVFCDDAPGAPALRKKYAAEHLEYIKTILDRIWVAGPFKEEAAPDYCGSCFIYRADSAREALELLFADPYYRAGIYKHYRVLEFRGVAGCWVGGKNW